jgi:hypothetical protein
VLRGDSDKVCQGNGFGDCVLLPQLIEGT